MKPLAILIPTYKRSGRLQKLVDNIRETTHNPHTIYFCVERDDPESYKIAKATGAKVYYNKYPATCSHAIQTIYEKSKEPYFLFGNDDFRFLPDWDKRAVEVLSSTNIMVLGLHDGNPQTKFSTIAMIKRKYIEEQSGVVDMPNRVLYPYEHNYVDDELTQTAQSRGVWSSLPEPCIIHEHHSFTWLSERNPHDETYAKNDTSFARDTELFHSRMHLWQ